MWTAAITRGITEQFHEYSTAYLFDAGDAVFVLRRRRQELPGDDGPAIASKWLTIAETPEPLPAEG